MSEAISRLLNLPSEQRTAVLAEIRRQAGIAGTEDGPGGGIPRRPRDGAPLPASYLQEQLLFLDRWQPGSAAYHIPFRFILHGPLDIEALRDALTAISDRHEVLRTTLTLHRGQPMQVVTPPAPVDLAVVDLAHVRPEQRAEMAEQLAREAAHTPFNLARGPLVRARLCRLADDEHELIWVAHHSVVDGQSLPVLVEELSAGYRRTAATREPLPVQFADYVLWQRAWLAGPDGERLVRYWQDQLADRPGTELPTDHPRPASQSFTGAMHHFTVPAELTTAARSFGADTGATLFMTLFAVYQVLLAGWTGERDLAVGTSVAGRTRPELQAMIGPLLNVVVLRDRIHTGASLRRLVGRARKVTLDALAHQELPFGQLVRHLAPARDGGRNPVFQTMFDVGGAAVEGRRVELADGLSMTARIIPLDVSQMDIAVVFDEAPDTGDLAGRFEYRTDLYRASTVRRLADAYVALLRRLLADPDRPVAEALDASM